MREFDELVRVVAALRAEGGCPWDRAQTAATLRPYLLEEAHEALDAIDRGDDVDLRKELGDLLFIVSLVSRIAEERGAFSLADVAGGVAQKMIRRHPHVFVPGHTGAGDEGTIAAWEARKAKEDPDRSALDGVPRSLPSLLRAHRVTEKAAGVGFDWPDISGVRAKLDEEVREFDEALASGDAVAIGDEFGDLLFTLVNLGRFLPISAEDALRVATAKFERRFRAVEDGARADGVALRDLGIDDLEARWQTAKRRG